MTHYINCYIVLLDTRCELQHWSTKSWRKSTRLWSAKSTHWCSRTMPSHTSPGRPKTSWKSWTALRFCYIQSTVLTVLHQITAFSEGPQIRLVWWSQGSMSRILWFEVGWTTRSESLPMDGKKTLEKWWSLFWRIIFVVYILYKTLKIKRYLFMKKEFKVLKKISQPLIKYLCGLNI